MALPIKHNPLTVRAHLFITINITTVVYDNNCLCRLRYLAQYILLTIHNNGSLIYIKEPLLRAAVSVNGPVVAFISVGIQFGTKRVETGKVACYYGNIHVNIMTGSSCSMFSSDIACDSWKLNA